MSIEKRDIDIVVKNIKSLPTPPVVLTKIMELVNDPEATITDIEMAINLDPNIVAKVLRISNSAYYRRANDVTSLKQAIVVLGINEIKNITLGVSVYGKFSSKDDFVDFDLDSFWFHSVAVGIMSKIISDDFKNYNSSAAFTAGLLHDIGILIMSKHLGKDYNNLILSTKDTENSLQEVELEKLNCNHEDIGQWLAENWNFPEELKIGIAKHHSEDVEDKFIPLIANINLAQFLITKYKKNEMFFEESSLKYKKYWIDKGLTTDGLKDYLDKLKEEEANIKSFLTGLK